MSHGISDVFLTKTDNVLLILGKNRKSKKRTCITLVHSLNFKRYIVGGSLQRPIPDNATPILSPKISPKNVRYRKKPGVISGLKKIKMTDENSFEFLGNDITFQG